MPKPQRINQALIAKATGVSSATVSLVLRGGTGAAAKTREKVLAVAKKMGYRPNALVHSIRSGKSRTVGVLIHPWDSYWTSVLEGIHDRLIEAEHIPIILWSSEQMHDSEKEAYAIKQINRMLDRWVDGVILWPYFATLYAKYLKEFERRNIPIVTVEHTVPQLKADTVECDEAEIARLAVGHLAGLGHRCFMVLSGPKSVGWADKRCEAFRREIAKLRGGVCEELRIPYNADISEEIAKRLRANPAITAVAAGTDHLAAQVYKAALMAKREIPSQLSLIGVGNLNFVDILHPPLTTILQDGYAVGRQAAQIELERSSGILTGEPRVFQVPVRLVERQSTAKAPKLSGH